MTRFKFPNYMQITKFEKSEYNAIKKTIFSTFQKLGKHGSTKPVAYDTAWAARVPQFDNLAKPAFPQCLQWLRDHQKEDGSWGDDYPPSIHSKILNTFTAVLALSQWNLQEDRERIRNGVNAMWKLSEVLPREKTESSTFEMILSALVDDSRIFGLDIPYESYEWLATTGRAQVKNIQRGILSNRPNQCWAILEAAGNTVELHPAYYRSEIKRHGLIAAQPSTTAFILRQARLRGEDFIEAEWALEKLSLENNGGLPHLCPSDNFDIIHGLDLLTKVGINPVKNDKHAAARNSIKILRERWDPQNGIGFSSSWEFSDHNCSKAAMGVLNRTLNKTEGVINVIKTGEHMCHCSIDQKLQNQSKVAKIAAQLDVKITPPVKPFCLSSPPLLGTLKSVSKYYRLMQTVFKASSESAKALPDNLNEIIKSQNCDGGWGDLGASSAEETAYVCLALFELTRHSSEILYSIDFIKLVDYVRNIKKTSEDESLWYWKVSFSSPGLSEAAIIVAKYAVFQIQRFCIMADALNDNKLGFDEVGISDDTSKVIFHGNILRFSLEGWPENTENRKMVMENLMPIFFKEDDISPGLKALIETFFDFSYLSHPVELQLEYRIIDVVGIVLIIVLDDIVDLFHPGTDDMVFKLNEFFHVIIEILEDKNHDPATLPTFDVPDISCVTKCLFFLQKAIRQNGWNCETYIKELKDLFYVNTLVRKDLCNNIEPTAKRYLQIHKISTTLKVLIQQNFMIDGITSSTQSENLSVYKRFLDSACKATRVNTEFASVPKDQNLPTLDNFCLRLQHQYQVSIEEAIKMNAKKTNKEILKMHMFRTIIQRDSKYMKYTDLPVRMKYVDAFVYGAFIWGMVTDRYKSKWTNNVVKVEHNKKDATFVRNLCFDF